MAGVSFSCRSALPVGVWRGRIEKTVVNSQPPDMQAFQIDLQIAGPDGREFPFQSAGDPNQLATAVARSPQWTAQDWRAEADRATRQLRAKIAGVELHIPRLARREFDRAFQRAADSLLCWYVTAGDFTWDQIAGSTVMVRIGPNTVRCWLQ